MIFCEGLTVSLSIRVYGFEMIEVLKLSLEYLVTYLVLICELIELRSLMSLVLYLVYKLTYYFS